MMTSNGKYFENVTKNELCVLSQGSFKKFMKKRYGVDVFRWPDEAYVFDGKPVVVKILEKKAQSVNGSVETKLWSGPSLKREYEHVLGSGFEVHYAFCVNDFLKKKFTSTTDKKYLILNKILKESDITVLFGDDQDYKQQLSLWLYGDKNFISL